ncbi:MAG: YncE family protein [Proteiniphilum sp.]|nr:YncE family protein [Proteiniphilum sp.]MDD3908348.1 YncE family protein [Proteiniphilum sp.]MDD4415170.1 YncE family protein [Proteiniphilum sp.]
MARKKFILISLMLILLGCREEYEIFHSSQTRTSLGEENTGNLKGFYLLNEGNMGSNKASLDYFDFATGIYHRNIYAEANPTVVKELGDVGNDIQIYGSKLYAVINVSNYIEVMEAKTAKHVGKIEIPNVRYIKFHNGKAYASSYVAPVKFDQNARVGYVAEIDTATLEVLRTVNVGYQPEELVIANNKIYVANSGGYMFPNYDRTVSVIDLETFKEEKKIDVGINLHRLRKTPYHELIVSSRGDYYNEPSKLFVIDLDREEVTQTIEMAVSNLDIVGDSAYIYAVEWSHNTQKNTITYGILNIKTKEIVSRNFIKDGTDKDIVIPYGVKVNPVTKDIYVTDAIDYVTPGTLLCYNKFGKLKWKVDTGDIPGHFAFLFE